MGPADNLNPDDLSATQVAVILANCILGTGILTLPRVLAVAMDTPDGWIPILIAGLIVIAFTSWLVKIGAQYPGQTFFDYSPALLGVWMSRLVVTVMIVYFICISAYEVRVLAEVVDMFLLEQTPKAVIIITMMCVSAYLIFGGLGAISRMCGLLLPPTVLVLFFCFALSMKIFDANNLRPVLGEGPVPVLQGIWPSLMMFLGFEIMYVLPGRMKHPKKAYRAVWYGIIITVAVYSFSYLAVIGGLSTETTKTVTWPLISLIRSFEYTGILFERFDSFLMAIWLMKIYSAFMLFHYLLVSSLKVFGVRRPYGGAFAVLPVIYMLAMLPRSTFAILYLFRYVEYLFLFTVGVVPALCMVMNWIRRRSQHEA
ncbi:GerAB/ArcD/ProY family transporter [Paenibacillus apiarius]|uniref:Spore germination protein n=1 Tax=Paenibacillus apiarius TaxID=46240 RepID=A0ABT4DY66_9BACL|nr:GerAB/ArcD/ProY family transporter [Paenibacillus apiarius]MCY9515996.1 spore germination protein [Paenibacillus apiarius]MCY9520906.1 spore germination protein [Paenibacillus apiarius]MCY9553611.1 spore germination protein [Paenibacillus apiarius]MCY9557866.1 spore germination protein [Paenibacillus apiarius]MCY9685721.1 spore germination protein [Paenibacillus apiarius]